MNKLELIAGVAAKAKITKVAAAAVVDALTDSIRESLSKGGGVILVGFGSFSVAKRSARKGRNPQTNQVIDIPATRVPRFRAGKQLRSAVRRAK